MTDYSFIYITTRDKDEARKIGRALVEARLAACTNILGAVDSIYRWEGAIRQETEVVLIAKTRTELVESLIAKVKSLHSYDCPCVVALPVQQGAESYLDWIGAETR